LRKTLLSTKSVDNPVDQVRFRRVAQGKCCRLVGLAGSWPFCFCSRIHRPTLYARLLKRLPTASMVEFPSQPPVVHRRGRGRPGRARHFQGPIRALQEGRRGFPVPSEPEEARLPSEVPGMAEPPGPPGPRAPGPQHVRPESSTHAHLGALRRNLRVGSGILTTPGTFARSGSLRGAAGVAEQPDRELRGRNSPPSPAISRVIHQRCAGWDRHPHP
jgi:hypothetical protein